MIKDFLNLSDGHLKFEITKKLIDRCKVSWMKYQQYLDEARKLEEQL